MKTPISGKMAATPETKSSSPSKSHNPTTATPKQLQFEYITTRPEPIEPLVTKKTLAEHYGLSVRTINYAMTLGLPKVPVGGCVRFRFSEVQPWFEKNGCRRFAAEGIKLAIQKSLLQQYHLNLSDQVQITVSKPKPPKSNTPNRKSYDCQHKQ
jgi:hypothetical protein